MTGTFTLILLVLAFVLFLVAIWNPGPPRINLIAAGLASYVLAELLGRVGH